MIAGATVRYRLPAHHSFTRTGTIAEVLRGETEIAYTIIDDETGARSTYPWHMVAPADTVLRGDYVSHVEDGERQYGWVLGTRADGQFEVSAGYNGVAVLHPRKVTGEEAPPRARK